MRANTSLALTCWALFSAFAVLTLRVLTTILGGRCHYCAHFAEEETETGRLNDFPEASWLVSRGASVHTGRF